MEKQIEIPNIELELQKIWRSQTVGNQLKASLFNLVIYSHEQRRTEYLKEVIQNFILKFPCRIIFINCKKDAEVESLKVSVTDRPLGDSANAISCDQIYIEVTPSLLHRVPYIILPHFIPDLPIYLLWGQDPIYEHEVLPSLEQYAVRLIYDSECNHNLKLFSLKILEKMHKSKLEFMDVSWGLIAGWRDALAVSYDSAEKLAALKDADDVDIVYNAVQIQQFYHTERQAIYFGIWLASQMDWRFVENRRTENEIKLFFHNGNHQLVMTLISDHQPDLPPGQLIYVEINSKNHHAVLKLQENNPGRIVVNMTTENECELPFIVTVSDPRRGTGVLKELFFQRPSYHYKEMLNYLSQIDLDL